jgi:hypothetical protein
MATTSNETSNIRSINQQSKAHQRIFSRGLSCSALARLNGKWKVKKPNEDTSHRR